MIELTTPVCTDARGVASWSAASRSADRRDGARFRVEEGEQPGEMACEQDVVARQVGDDRRARRVEADVERGPEATVAVSSLQPQALVAGNRVQTGAHVVRRSVVDDDQLPVADLLGEQRGDRAP